MLNLLDKIFNGLIKSKYMVLGPIKEDGEIVISSINSVPSTSLLSTVSDRPYKYFFMP